MEFKRVNREQRNLELDQDFNGVYVNPTGLNPNQFYQDMVSLITNTFQMSDK